MPTSLVFSSEFLVADSGPAWVNSWLIKHVGHLSVTVPNHEINLVTKMRGLFLLTPLEVSVHGQLDLLILKCSSQGQGAKKRKDEGLRSPTQQSEHFSLGSTS